MDNTDLANIRSRIQDLKGQIVSTESSAASPDEMREWLRSNLEQQAAMWSGRIAQDVRTWSVSRSMPEHRKMFHISTEPGLDRNAPSRVDVGGLLAYSLGVDRMMDLIGPHIQAQSAGQTSADRKARLATLNAELFRAERDEECIIVEIEARGVSVARRADADPAAVLYLEVVPQ